MLSTYLQGVTVSWESTQVKGDLCVLEPHRREQGEESYLLPWGGVRDSNQATSQGLQGVLQANKGGERLQAERVKGAWCILEIASSSVAKINGEVRVSCVVSLKGRGE